VSAQLPPVPGSRGDDAAGDGAPAAAARPAPAAVAMPRLAVFPKGFFDAIMEGRMSVPEWIGLAGRLDVEGVELYSGFLAGADGRRLAALRTHAADHGLELPMLCHSPDFTQPDRGARAEEVRRTREMLKVTAELGGGFCRVLSGQNRPGLDEREALDWVVECLWELVPHAAAQGVVMCIENHYKDGTWAYPEFAQSRERYLHILAAVDSPWLKAQYDASNAMVAGEDPYELLDAVLPRIATVHASDRYLETGDADDLRRHDGDARRGYASSLRHGAIGQGVNDYDRILGTLAASGYAGWISIEDGEGPTIEIGMDNLHESARFLNGRLARHFGAVHDG
jgi:sugar phosphate isomerase/epimerase